MDLTKSFHAFSALTIVCLLLAGCASVPELLPISSVVPDGVDISGKWELRDVPGSKRLPADGGDPGIRIPPANARQMSTRRAGRGRSGVAVSVFIENGELLKISQTAAGLFISFDRSVVEEYTFGENRIVSVGPIEARRVSGWEKGSFVIRTLDDDGAILTESWQLADGGKVLVRELSITSGDEEKYSALQRFDKA